MSKDPIRQVAVLVGGKGTRLGKITHDVPKPMLPIAGERPFLDYIIEMITRYGFTDIILLAGHLGNRVEHVYHNKKIGDATIRVLRERSAFGTGGALTLAHDLLDERFILMNGDAFFDINLRVLEYEANECSAQATIALKHINNVSRFGRIIEESGRIVNMVEKDPTYNGAGTINGGIYVLHRDVLDLIKSLPCSIESDIFPILIERGQMRGRHFEGYFLDIGVPDALERGHLELPLRRVRPAAFLDSASLIDARGAYGFKAAQPLIYPGAAQAIQYLNDAGYFVFILIRSENDDRMAETPVAQKFWSDLFNEILLKYGAYVDAFYFVIRGQYGCWMQMSSKDLQAPTPLDIFSYVRSKWLIDIKKSFLVIYEEAGNDSETMSGITTYCHASGGIDEFIISLPNFAAQRCLTSP